MFDFLTPELLVCVGVVMVVFFGLQIGAAVMVYAERKVAAYMQQRMGPTLVGPAGLLQPIADIVKLIFKEDLRPKAADTALFLAAPVISVAAAYVAFAPVPFGAASTFFGLLDEPMPLLVADINVAVLAIFAVASMGVYGIVLAGWASNSKYSLLGGLRSSAQMISYELSYGIALATVVLLANSMSLREIVDQQAGYWYGVIPKWNIFAMFFLAEYINMITVSAVATNLFLGGWHGPFLPPEYGWIWFLIKLAVLLFGYLWLRWTLPRFRYDQLMSFGWKVLLPIATVNLILTAAAVLYFEL